MGSRIKLTKLLLIAPIILIISCNSDQESTNIDSASTEIDNWLETAPISKRASHTCVENNGFLYVTGGYYYSGSALVCLDDVNYARINSDGTIESWNNTTPFGIRPRRSHTSVIYNNYLYIIGGDSTTYSLDDVQYANINPTGSVDSWQTTTSLPEARFAHTSVTYGNYLYIIGGFTSHCASDIIFTTINNDGTIGSWNSTTSMPFGRCDHTSFVSNGFIYVIGGRECDDNYYADATRYLNDVLFAKINSDGTIDSWNSTASFLGARYKHSTLQYNGYVYLIGGMLGPDRELRNDVQYARINTNGTISAWSVTTPINNNRWKHASIAYNDYIYVLGGSHGINWEDDENYFLTSVEFAEIYE